MQNLTRKKVPKKNAKLSNENLDGTEVENMNSSP